MNAYKYYPEALAATISTPQRRLEVEDVLKRCSPIEQLDRLAFHPELLSRLLLNGSIPFEVIRDRPALVIPTFRAATDPMAFVCLAAPHLVNLTEGIADTYILDARAAGIVDLLLSTAVDRIRSPWRLWNLGFIALAATRRQESPDALAVGLSDYILSGDSQVVEKQFRDAAMLEDEDLFSYFEARLQPENGKPLPIDHNLADGVSACLAYNLLAGHGPVRATQFPISAYQGIVSALQADPIWSAEFVLGKGPDAPEDLAYWFKDVEFTYVENPQVREELASLFKESPSYAVTN